MSTDAAEFTDPLLASLYDTACPPGPDDAFHLDLADRLDARSVLDVGCGTGALAVALSRPGRRVIGLEPAPPMLALARHRPGAEAVDWLAGTARDLPGLDLPGLEVDLALMKAHVPQLIVEDAEWTATLHELARVVRPGGRLAFETRDPRTLDHGGGLKWEAPRRFTHPVHGTFEVWQELHEVHRDEDGGGTTIGTLHYRFADGREATSRSALRFRTLERLRQQLGASGFEPTEVFGDFDRRPVGPDTPEFVIVATRTAPVPGPGKGTGRMTA